MRRTDMETITRVLKLNLGEGHSMARVAEAAAVSKSTVHDILSRARAAGIGWPLPDGAGEEELRARLYPRKRRAGQAGRIEPDFGRIREELAKPRKRKAAPLTRQLLWEEYCEEARAAGGRPYSYSWFCASLPEAVGVSEAELEMRFEYPPGEYLMTDFSGKTLPLSGRNAGRSHAEIFVAVLPCSQKIFVHAVPAQSAQWWALAHRAAFEFYGGAPAYVIHDNLAAGAARNRSLDDLRLNGDFREVCDHYGVVALPARTYRPRDKGACESSVRFVGTGLLAALRHRQFFSCDEMNVVIRERLAVLNGREMRAHGRSRDRLFAEERPALKPLPARRYEWSFSNERKVQMDYHVALGKKYYSVPWAHVGRRVRVRVGERAVEIFSLEGGERLAVHPPASETGRYFTIAEHMPSRHRQALELRHPDRESILLAKASRAGPAVRRWAEASMQFRDYREHAYRGILGILRLGEQHPQEKVNAACEASVLAGRPYYGFAGDWLKDDLERKGKRKGGGGQPGEVIPAHGNIRGGGNYRAGRAS